MVGSADLELEGISGATLSKHLNLVPAASVETPAPAVASSSSASLPARDQNASFFGMSSNACWTDGTSSVYVEFTSCMSGGIFAYVYDSSTKGILLGNLKTPQKLEQSSSIQAVCKIHKPSASCKCWITCGTSVQKGHAFQELLKWFAAGCVSNKGDHIDSSATIREAFGMRVRNRR